MNEVIKEIIKRKNVSVEEKEKALKELLHDIDLASKILSGELTYCLDCDDFYYSKSFFHEDATVKEDVCVYSDPINSGGDEYEKQTFHYDYLVCPKGHKSVINKRRM